MVGSYSFTGCSDIFELNARRIYWRPIGKVDSTPSKPTPKEGAPYSNIWVVCDFS